MRRSQTFAIVLCAVACALGPPTAASADVGGVDITGFLNAQRAAHGIPAGIVEDAALSDGCAKHNAYGAANPGLSHEEDPDKPGYTPEGDRVGRTSVLYPAGGGPWTATRNPFEIAPIHLHQLLAPRIDRIGASENQGYGCATTLASRNRPAPPADVTYTYPGNGATDWPPAQTALEGPYTPGQLVGIPAGTRTGPYLYVMFDGPDLTVFDTATATGATLTGPGGPVAVAVVDNHTPGLEGYLPTGLEVIPRAALAPQATYTATVAASVTTQGGSGPARGFSRSWSFTTRGLENIVAPMATGSPAVTVSTRVRSGGPIRIAITSQAAYSLRLVVETLRGRAIISDPARSVPGGRMSTSRLVVPPRYSRSGRRLRVRLVIRTASGRYTIRRTVRFG